MADRHRFRATWHDYGCGFYFVTICSYGKSHIFGRINSGEMSFSPLGHLVEDHIHAIPLHHPAVAIHNSVVMPNHVHIVLSIYPDEVGTRHVASASPMVSEHNLGCLKPAQHGPRCADFHHNSILATVIGSFKASVTREARKRRTGGRDMSRPYWQVRYHEHIIRTQADFDRIMTYVDNNVDTWATDCFNTPCTG